MLFLIRLSLLPLIKYHQMSFSRHHHCRHHHCHHHHHRHQYRHHFHHHRHRHHLLIDNKCWNIILPWCIRSPKVITYNIIAKTTVQYFNKNTTAESSEYWQLKSVEKNTCLLCIRNKLVKAMCIFKVLDNSNH